MTNLGTRSLQLALLVAPPASGKTSLSEFESVGFFLGWAM